MNCIPFVVDHTYAFSFPSPKRKKVEHRHFNIVATVNAWALLVWLVQVQFCGFLNITSSCPILNSLLNFLMCILSDWIFSIP
jgi:hypothetical protein